MIWSLEILHNVTDIVPNSLGMPNEAWNFATKCRSVKLNDKLNLHNVLFAPGMSCSLISVVQLIDDLFCKVAFTRKLCVI